VSLPRHQGIGCRGLLAQLGDGSAGIESEWMLHGGFRRSGRRVGPGDPLTGGGDGVTVPCNLNRLLLIAGAEADPVARCPNPVDVELSGPDVIGRTTAEVQQPDLVTEPRARVRLGDAVG
jgi:hypothetical protein